MDIALQNGLFQLPEEETLIITAGGWEEFGYATIGTLCIAAAPIAVASGNPWAAVALVGTGLYNFGNI